MHQNTLLPNEFPQFPVRWLAHWFSSHHRYLRSSSSSTQSLTSVITQTSSLSWSCHPLNQGCHRAQIFCMKATKEFRHPRAYSARSKKDFQAPLIILYALCLSRSFQHLIHWPMSSKAPFCHLSHSKVSKASSWEHSRAVYPWNIVRSIFIHLISNSADHSHSLELSQALRNILPDEHLFDCIYSMLTDIMGKSWKSRTLISSSQCSCENHTITKHNKNSFHKFAVRQLPYIIIHPESHPISKPSQFQWSAANSSQLPQALGHGVAPGLDDGVVGVGWKSWRSQWWSETPRSEATYYRRCPNPKSRKNSYKVRCLPEAMSYHGERQERKVHHKYKQISKMFRKRVPTDLQLGICKFMASSAKTALQKSRSLSRMEKVLGSAWICESLKGQVHVIHTPPWSTSCFVGYRWQRSPLKKNTNQRQNPCEFGWRICTLSHCITTWARLRSPKAAAHFVSFFALTK